MLYEHYEKLIQSKYKLIRFYRTNKTLIYILLAISCLLFTAFGITKGMVYETDIPESFEYGETLTFNSKAIFSSVNYSYTLVGEDDWSDELPSTAGEYVVKITTKQLFGGSKTETYDFSILPKETTVLVENNSVIYGDQPILDLDLANGDYIDSFNYEFEDLLESQTVLDINGLIIKNLLGEDVSDSYEFGDYSQTVTILPRAIQVALVDKTGVYNGQSLSSKDTLITGKMLLEGHRLEVHANGSQINVGTSKNQITELHIYEGTTEVTDKYDITQIEGILEVTPIEITIKTDGYSYLYDDTEHFNNQYTVSHGELVTNHQISIISTTNIKNVGVIENVLGVEILDDTDHDVSQNYSITYDLGLLEVIARPLTFTSESSSKPYDGFLLENENYHTGENELISGHSIQINSTQTPTLLDVGLVVNELQFDIVNSENVVVTENYDIETIFGTIEITKLFLSLETASLTRIYDGESHHDSSYQVLDGEVNPLHTLNILDYTEVIDAGVYDNVLSIEILDSSNKVITQNYDIRFTVGIISIQERDLTVKPLDQSFDYTGSVINSSSAEDLSNTLIEGHTILIETSAWETNAGVYTNNIETIIIKDENQKNVTKNYRITTNSGNLTINQLSITVKPFDFTKIYDGEELTSNLAIDVNNSLVIGHTINITTESIKDVSVIENDIQFIEILDGEGHNVTGNYDILLQTGLLEITERYILIKTASQTKTYDGLILENIDYSIVLINANSTLLDGHSLTAINHTQEKNVGLYTNEVLFDVLDSEGFNVTDNYHLSYDYGSLLIKARELTVSAVNATKVYDGTELKNNTPAFTGILVDGDVLTITTSGTQTDVGVSDNFITDVTILNGTEDVTGNYNITTLSSLLEVTSRVLNITTSDGIWDYDGTYHFNDQYTLNNPEDLLPGDNMVLSSYPSVKEVTNPDEDNRNLLDISVLYPNATENSNYEINYTYGTLVINPLDIVVKPENLIQMYNGDLVTHNIPEIVSGSIAAGQTVYILTSAKEIHAGYYDNDIVTISISDGTSDVSSNYNISIESGFIEITPVPITFTGDVVSKIYDAQTIDFNVSVLDGDLIGTDTFSVTQLVNDNINVTNGAVLALYEIDIVGGGLNSDYVISYEFGTYEIFKRDITITADSALKHYDGQALIADGYSITSGSLPNDNFSIELDVVGSQTLVGIGDNVIENEKIYNNLDDVSNNFNISVVAGSLTILQREVQIRPEPLSVEYDGTVHLSELVDFINGSLVQGHTITIQTTGSLKNAGTVVNTISSYEILDENNLPITNQYEVLKVASLITVEPFDLIVSTNTVSKIYDGINIEGHVLTFNRTLPEGHSINVISYTEFLNVDSRSNVTDFEILDQYGIYHSSNYDIETDYGTLTITPIILNISTGTSVDTYDGTNLFDISYSIDSGDLLFGHNIQTTSYSVLDVVDSVDNIHTYEVWDASSQDVTANYDIVVHYGTLTLLHSVLEIDIASSTKVYDGTVLENINYHVTNGSLATGHTMSVIDHTQLTDATTVENVLTFEIRDASNQVVTDNYQIIPTLGQLTITKRTIDIETQSATFIYNGQEQANQNFTETSNNLAIGDTLSVENYTTIKNIGTVSNVLDIMISNETSQNVTSNYIINYTTGNLTVSQLSITIKPEDLIREYDGEALMSLVAVDVFGDLISGHTISIETTGSVTNVGVATSTISTYEILDDLGVGVTGNYLVSISSGSLEVTQLPITIKPYDESKAYDGQALVPESIEFLVNGLAINQTMTYDLIGTQTVIGSSNSSITNLMIYDGTTLVNSNYDITYEVGTLTVSQVAMQINLYDITRTYTGSEITHSPTDYWIPSDNLPDGFTITFDILGGITNVGTINASIDEASIIIRNESSQDVTSNYSFTTSTGAITVRQKSITIKSDSDYKFYDGVALTADSSTVSSGALVSGHTYSLTITGSQTESGSSANTIDETSIVIYDGAVDVTSNYNISFITGILTVF